LIEEGCVDDTDGGARVEDEGDGDAEHGKEVRVVYCAVEGVDAPGWAGGDEVVSWGAFGVGFFADETGKGRLVEARIGGVERVLLVAGIFLGDLFFDKGFHVCCEFNQ
jgi:hypothetical protein